VYCELNKWPDESIYEGNRLAMPDEVVNFKRGDGIEKAICLANVIGSRLKGEEIHLENKDLKTIIRIGKILYQFTSMKNISFNKSWKSDY
jgi:hypothetical protein